MRWLRGIIRVIIYCVVLLALTIALEIAIGWKCTLAGELRPGLPQPADRKAASSGIKDYARPEDDTLLSYPEWYIVWSYQEKADFQQRALPSSFPYFGAVRQYWSAYCCISRLIRGKYPFNAGEQTMLIVIGTSFSAEYILKGMYEKTIGRLSEWSSHHEFTDEDLLAYQVARDYADFVHVRPFYEFRFARRVPALWQDTGLFGPHWFRKWERRFFLSIDYSLEAFYCWAIERLTHLTYGFEPTETYAWIENASPSIIGEIPGIKIVRQLGYDTFIVDIPRYQEFTGVTSTLAGRGVKFVEIAGNSQILVSMIARRSATAPVGALLFSSPILTEPQLERRVVSSDVRSLSSLSNDVQKSGATLEHIYDY